jgi:hypothetical protein
VPTRLVAEQHVLEDLGRVPSLSEWLENLRPRPWMDRPRKLSRELESRPAPPEAAATPPPADPPCAADSPDAALRLARAHLAALDPASREKFVGDLLGGYCRVCYRDLVSATDGRCNCGRDA